MKYLLLVIGAFLFSAVSIAQEVDITRQLKMLEMGQVELVRKELEKMHKKNPKDASVTYLKALLMEDGKEAAALYSNMLEQFPKSKYADAAAYKLFSYYYTLGAYASSDVYYEKLEEDYPQSPYLAFLKRNNMQPTEPKSEEKSQIETLSVSKNHSPARYIIQAGAFIDSGNAKKLMSSLEDDGYFTEMGVKEAGGSLLNIVYCGRFASLSEAQQVLEVINKKYRLQGRILDLSKDKTVN